MKRRAIIALAASAVALLLVMLFLGATPLGPSPPKGSAHASFTQSFVIWQSDGVFASGTVIFTKDGIPIGESHEVSCEEPGHVAYYEFLLPEEPNDISWEIFITWDDGSHGYWQENNQPWPATYTKTHSPSFVAFGVAPVGGIAELPPLAGASAEEAATAGGGSGWSSASYAALTGGLAAAVVALSAGAWYARRRLLR
jgi:hypothetical protein